MLPETGKISMNQINIELKKSSTSKTSLNDSDVRKLANINVGKISLNDFHGKRHGEYVSGYTIYSGNFESGNSFNQNYSFSVQIPKYIISGEFTLSVTKSGKNHNGGSSSSASINKIGGTAYTNNTTSINVKKNNFPKQTLGGSVTAGYGNYMSGNGTSRPNSNTTIVTLQFTGEWEV